MASTVKLPSEVETWPVGVTVSVSRSGAESLEFPDLDLFAGEQMRQEERHDLIGDRAQIAVSALAVDQPEVFSIP